MSKFKFERDPRNRSARRLAGVYRKFKIANLVFTYRFEIEPRQSPVSRGGDPTGFAAAQLPTYSVNGNHTLARYLKPYQKSIEDFYNFGLGQYIGVTGAQIWVPPCMSRMGPI